MGFIFFKFRSTFIKTLGFLIFLGMGTASAQENKAARIRLKIPNYKVTTPTPYTVILDFDDGRQAQVLTEQIKKVPEVAVKLDLVESNCPRFKPTSKDCTITVLPRLQIMALVWTHYPEHPENVGRVVKIKRYSSDPNGTFEEPEDVLLNLDIADEETIYKDSPHSEQEKWRLTCEDQNFFNSFLKQDKTLLVMSLSAELSLSNPETAQNENRGLKSLENVLMTSTSKGFVWQSIDSQAGFFTILAGQNLNFVVGQSIEKACEINFSNDLSAIAQTLTSLQDVPPNPSKLEVTTWLGFGSRNFRTDLMGTFENKEGVLE